MEALSNAITARRMVTNVCCDQVPALMIDDDRKTALLGLCETSYLTLLYSTVK